MSIQVVRIGSILLLVIIIVITILSLINIDSGVLATVTSTSASPSSTTTAAPTTSDNGFSKTSSQNFSSSGVSLRACKFTTNNSNTYAFCGEDSSSGKLTRLKISPSPVTLDFQSSADSFSAYSRSTHLNTGASFLYVVSQSIMPTIKVRRYSTRSNETNFDSSLFTISLTGESGAEAAIVGDTSASTQNIFVSNDQTGNCLIQRYNKTGDIISLDLSASSSGDQLARGMCFDETNNRLFVHHKNSISNRYKVTSILNTASSLSKLSSVDLGADNPGANMDSITCDVRNQIVYSVAVDDATSGRIAKIRMNPLQYITVLNTGFSAAGSTCSGSSSGSGSSVNCLIDAVSTVQRSSNGVSFFAAYQRQSDQVFFVDLSSFSVQGNLTTSDSISQFAFASSTIAIRGSSDTTNAFIDVYSVSYTAPLTPESFSIEVARRSTPTTLDSVVNSLGEFNGNMLYPLTFTTGCQSFLEPLNADIPVPFSGNVTECRRRLLFCQTARVPSAVSATTCSSTIVSAFADCLSVYAQCITEASKFLSLSQDDFSSCSWPVSLADEAEYARRTGIFTSADCDIFTFHFTKIYGRCSPSSGQRDAICNSVVQTFKFSGNQFDSPALDRVQLIQNRYTAFPRGMKPIVISKDSNDCDATNATQAKVICTRPLNGATCFCPSGNVQRFQAYVPSTLTAADNDVCGKAASNFDLCDDGESVPAVENISFVVNSTITAVSSSSSSSRRAQDDDGNGCPDPRVRSTFKIIAPNAQKQAVIQSLLICRPTDTNIFILSKRNENFCYRSDEQVNVDTPCRCLEGQTNVGFPILYFNETLREIEAGTMIICNYPPAKVKTDEQIATNVLISAAALASGPAVSSIQLGATVSLISCRFKNSEAQKAGGREAITPFRIGKSPANGLLFIIVVMFGATFLHAFVVFVAALLMYCVKGSRMKIEVDPEKNDELYAMEPDDDKDGEDDVDQVSVATSLEGGAEVEKDDGDENKVPVVRSDDGGDDENEEMKRSQQDEVEKTENNSENIEETTQQLVEIDKTESNDDMSTRKVTIIDDENNSNESNSNNNIIENSKDDEENKNDYSNNQIQRVTKIPPPILVYDPSPTFTKILFHFAGMFRFPHFSIFLIRILSQGLFFESIYLMSVEPDVKIKWVGAGGLLVSLILLGVYTYFGIRAHMEFRARGFYEYKIGYDDSYKIIQYLGMHGLWNRRFKFVRSFEAIFGDFNGTSGFLYLIVPLQLYRQFLLAIAAGVDIEDETSCRLVYYCMVLVLWGSGIIMIYAKSDRLSFDIYANAILSFLTGFLLLISYHVEWGIPATTVTLIITYFGAFCAAVSGAFIAHEIIYVIPKELSLYEIDEDEEEDDRSCCEKTVDACKKLSKILLRICADCGDFCERESVEINTDKMKSKVDSSVTGGELGSTLRSSNKNNDSDNEEKEELQATTTTTGTKELKYVEDDNINNNTTTSSTTNIPTIITVPIEEQLGEANTVNRREPFFEEEEEETKVDAKVVEQQQQPVVNEETTSQEQVAVAVIAEQQPRQKERAIISFTQEVDVPSKKEEEIIAPPTASPAPPEKRSEGPPSPSEKLQQLIRGLETRESKTRDNFIRVDEAAEYSKLLEKEKKSRREIVPSINNNDAKNNNNNINNNDSLSLFEQEEIAARSNNIITPEEEERRRIYFQEERSKFDAFRKQRSREHFEFNAVALKSPRRSTRRSSSKPPSFSNNRSASKALEILSPKTDKGQTLLHYALATENVETFSNLIENNGGENCLDILDFNGRNLLDSVVDSMQLGLGERAKIYTLMIEPMLQKYDRGSLRPSVKMCPVEDTMFYNSNSNKSSSSDDSDHDDNDDHDDQQEKKNVVNKNNSHKNCSFYPENAVGRKVPCFGSLNADNIQNMMMASSSSSFSNITDDKSSTLVTSPPASPLAASSSSFVGSATANNSKIKKLLTSFHARNFDGPDWYWEKDEVGRCARCGKEVGRFSRHHCRSCGRLLDGGDACLGNAKRKIGKYRVVSEQQQEGNNNVYDNDDEAKKDDAKNNKKSESAAIGAAGHQQQQQWTMSTKEVRVCNLCQVPWGKYDGLPVSSALYLLSSNTANGKTKNMVFGDDNNQDDESRETEDA